MSNPENPLASYRSYSYHHILMACDTTTVAEEIGQNLDIELATSSFVPKSELSESDVVKVLGKGRYIPIINSLVGGNFIIDSVKWDTIVAPKSDRPEDITTTVIGGQMEIVEPMGIQFLNTLNQVSDLLGSDPSGLTYVLKTVFIGYKDDGSVGQVFNIQPFMLSIINVVGSFDTGGGTYTLSFVGIANGMAQQPQVIRITENSSINVTAKDVSLKSAIETHLQEKVTSSYNNYIKDLKAHAPIIDGDNPGKEVNYIIKFANEHDGKPSAYLDPAYMIDNIPTNLKSKEDDGGHIAFGKDTSIIAAIQAIMKSCTKVVEEISSKKDKDGNVTEKSKYQYKINTTLESKLEGESVSYTFVYTIGRYLRTESVVDKLFNKDDITAPDGNFIEFDYFFSGKGTDIIDFDIKMNMGMAFLQTYKSAPNVAQDAADTLDGITPVPSSAIGGTPISTVKNSDKRVKLRPNSPVFFSTTAKDVATKNTKDPSATLNYQTQLARWGALESHSVQVKIMGNPILLDNQVILPSEISSSTPRVGTKEDICKNYDKFPILTKINIYMPSNGGQDFASQFWYKGYYYITKIENTFAGGEFTQVLHMFSIMEDPLAESKEAEKEETVKGPNK